MISKNKLYLYISSIGACLSIFVVEVYIQPGFLIKSFLKWLIFLLGIFLYAYLSKDKPILFSKIRAKQFYKMLGLGLAVYVLLLLGYFILQGWIDGDKIVQSLLTKERVTKDNFIYVLIYISICNSFLEELFFRGFIFGSLRNTNAKPAYIYSSLLFALYHVAIMQSWFAPAMFFLLVTGLFFVGIIFDYLSEKMGTFLAPWIVHGMANLAINTIACTLLGII